MINYVRRCVGYAFLMLCPVTAPGQALDTIPNDPDYYTERLAAFRAEPVTSGRVIFLGNSITEGGKWSELFKTTPLLNRGISGDNTFGVLARLEEIVRHKPAKLFLMIGVNDLSKNIPTHIVIQNIFSIVGRIRAESPKTQIFVQSLLPVNPGHKKFPARFNKQADMETINAQLKKYPDALHYTFVNIFNEFLDGSLKLDMLYTTDGLHLNSSGYVLWAKFLTKEKYL
jgi:lysophospholipase L1-like esterase